MITQQLQNAIAGIEAERKVEIDRETARIRREEITPFNAEVDADCQKALAELQTAHNKRIAELQAEFAAKRQAMIDLAEQNKNNNAEALISAGTANINARYDAVIAGLQQLLEKEG